MMRILLLAAIALALTATTAQTRFEVGGGRSGAKMERRLPDLRPVVTNRAGLPSRITVAIRNYGDAQAGASKGQYSCVSTGTKISQAGMGFFDVPVLQPGEQYALEVNCSSLSNGRLTDVCANNGKKVAESNYSNNCLRF
jgi:hypothetical protein